MSAGEPHETTVPLALLAHALRTPCGVVEGYARLLATGAVGRLDAAAQAAVTDLHQAARQLADTLTLLEPSDLPTPAPAAPVDPMTAFAAAAGRHGWQPDAVGEGAIEAWSWLGWETLAQVSLAAVDERAATRLTLTFDGTSGNGTLGTMVLRAEPAVPGSGDTALPGWAAEQLASSYGLQLDRTMPGRLAWSGRFGLHGWARRSWRRNRRQSAPELLG